MYVTYFYAARHNFFRFLLNRSFIQGQPNYRHILLIEDKICGRFHHEIHIYEALVALANIFKV